MKRIFFFINVFLAIALFASVGYNIVVKKDKDQPEYSVKKAGKKPAPAKPQTNYGIQTKKGDQETVIVKKNLFNSARNPGVQTGRMGGNTSQMTLVGVCLIEGKKGAIILQRTRNFRQFPQFGGRGGMPNWNNRNTQPQAAAQQYIRLGEKLANGYELTEVTRTGAVLTLNGSRLELPLQEASKNQTRTTSRPRQMSTQQQMLMMQRMQMMQQMQMMRMLQQNNRNQGQNNNYNPRGTYNVPNAGNRGGTQIRRR